MGGGRTRQASFLIHGWFLSERALVQNLDHRRVKQPFTHGFTNRVHEGVADGANIAHEM